MCRLRAEPDVMPRRLTDDRLQQVTRVESTDDGSDRIHQLEILSFHVAGKQSLRIGSELEEPVVKRGGEFPVHGPYRVERSPDEINLFRRHAADRRHRKLADQVLRQDFTIRPGGQLAPDRPQSRSRRHCNTTGASALQSKATGVLILMRYAGVPGRPHLRHHATPAAAARASKWRARSRCGRSYITPSMPTAPLPGLASNAATTARALAIAAAVGVNTSLMTGTCAGWIASLPAKPSRRASSLSRRRASRLRKSTVTVSIAGTCAAAAPARQSARASR